MRPSLAPHESGPPDLVERRPQPVDLLVRARRAVLPGGELPAAVSVRGGRIVAVDPIDVVVPARDEVVLSDDEALLPGLVDTHVHLQAPGRDGWEGFASGTRAALAGGVTTLVDMPLDGLPVTVDASALHAKRAAAEGACHADVAFWGGAVPATTAQDLADLAGAGVLGFKAYLCDSGLAEFPPLDADALARIAALVADLGLPLLVHAELPAPPPAASAPRSYADYLAAHPATEELRAVELVVDVARRTGARLHVVHLSTAAAAERIALARAAGTAVSGETCPHYLTLAAEEMPEPVAVGLVCPPVRESLEREGLWQALAHGSLGMVVSDHSPVPDAAKRPPDGDLSRVAPGISSVQLSLPLVWTGACARGHGLADVAAWMSAAPAALAGLAGRKGAIAVGHDADLVVFAPDEPVHVTPSRLWHRQSSTPYAGRELRGAVRRTWLRGVPVDLTVPTGRLLEGSSACASS
ncbi:MAG: allantoinase AllB [Kineosporiaceae bacterium]